MKKTRFWVALIAVLLALSAVAAALLAGRGQGGTAKIWQDGELLQTIDLTAVEEPYDFEVTAADGGVNEVRVEHGRIRVSAADCPDQICVRQGWISTEAAPVVCLPHGLVIEIVGTGGAEAIDAIT